MKATFLIAAAVGAALVPSLQSQARAQPSLFSDRELGVIDARELVQEQNGHQFHDGGQVILTILPQARARLASGVRLRIFRLGRSGRLPTPWKFFHPCFVFNSTVLVPAVSQGLLNLGTLEGLDYLTVEQNRVSDGRFLIVFEQGGDSREIVRLNRDSIRSYFSKALYIEVRQGRDYGVRDIRRRSDEIQQLILQNRAEVLINGPQRNCYRLRTADVRSDRGDRLAMLGDCAIPQAR